MFLPSLVQIGHREFSRTNFFKRFCLVEKMSWHAFHKKCFTKPGVLSCQIIFQYLLSAPIVEYSPFWLLISFSSKWYAVLTVNRPILEGLHINLSSALPLPSDKLHMVSASVGLKIWDINARFQLPVDVSMSSQTLASFANTLT